MIRIDFHLVGVVVVAVVAPLVEMPPPLVSLSPPVTNPIHVVGSHIA